MNRSSGSLEVELRDVCDFFYGPRQSMIDSCWHPSSRAPRKVLVLCLEGCDSVILR